MASQMQNALLLSGAATRASVEEWSKLHTSVMYSGIKKMPLELMLSNIDHIPKLYIYIFSGIFVRILQVHLVLTPGWECFLQKKPWLPHFDLLQQELQITEFVLWDNQLPCSFLRKLPRQKVPHGTTYLQYYFPISQFHSAKCNFISSGINAKLD